MGRPSLISILVLMLVIRILITSNHGLERKLSIQRSGMAFGLKLATPTLHRVTAHTLAARLQGTETLHQDVVLVWRKGGNWSPLVQVMVHRFLQQNKDLNGHMNIPSHLKTHTISVLYQTRGVQMGIMTQMAPLQPSQICSPLTTVLQLSLQHPTQVVLVEEANAVATYVPTSMQTPLPQSLSQH